MLKLLAGAHRGQEEGSLRGAARQRCEVLQLEGSKVDDPDARAEHESVKYDVTGEYQSVGNMGRGEKNEGHEKDGGSEKSVGIENDVSQGVRHRPRRGELPRRGVACDGGIFRG